MIQWAISYKERFPLNNWKGHGHYRVDTYFTGLGKVIKVVGEDEYNEDDTNVLIFHGVGNLPHLITTPDINPLSNLSNDDIDWIKSHPSLVLVFLSANETKPILDVYRKPFEKFKTYIREVLDIDNRVILQDCSYKLDTSGFQFIDSLEMIGGCSILQLNYPKSINRFDLSKLLSEVSSDGNFDKKVLNYTGRYRTSRALLHMIARDTFNNKDLLFSNVGIVRDFIEENETLTEAVSKFIHWDRRPSEEVIRRLIEYLNLGSDYNTAPVDLRSNFKNILLPNTEDYSRVFCDLVPETYGDREFANFDHFGRARFWTEKIAKPILCKRPFIVQANAGYLSMLEDLGFRTFSKWWNEDYDKDIKLLDSLDIIKSNLEYINSLSYSEIKDMYLDMIPVLEHNKRVMIDLIYDKDRLHLVELQNKLNA